MLALGRVGCEEPTIHPGVQRLKIGGTTATCIDLGGHECARRLWRDYIIDASGIVFMVDAKDKSRFPEARNELNKILTNGNLVGVPICVLGNKIDCYNAVSEAEFREAMGLCQTFGKDRVFRSEEEEEDIVEVFMCSIVKKMGFQDGFEWMLKFV